MPSLLLNHCCTIVSRGVVDLNKHVLQCPLNEGLYLGALVEGVLPTQIVTHKHDVQHFSVDDCVFRSVHTERHQTNVADVYILFIGSARIHYKCLPYHRRANTPTEMSAATTDADTDELSQSFVNIDISDVICPICCDVLISPRVYDCGHTTCEQCMYEIDIRTTAADTHTAEIFRCPICRSPTLKGWNKRPINYIIDKIASQHPNYTQRKQEVSILKDQRKCNIAQLPDTIDLAQTAYNSRINLALDLYEIILEKLYIAAKDGKGHIIIKEKAIVSEIEKVCDILSYQFFSKHNIYRMLTTRGECTIYLTKNAFSWRRNYENASWSDPTLEEIEDRSTPTSPIPNIPAAPPSLPPLVNTHFQSRSRHYRSTHSPVRNHN